MAQSSGKQVRGAIPIEKVGNVLGQNVPGGMPGNGRPIQPDFNLGDLRDTRWYTDFHAKFRDQEVLTIDDMVKQLLFFAELNFYLETIATSFLPRIVSIGTTAVQITQRARYPKAYIFLNPVEISGVSSSFTFYASDTRADGFNTVSSAVTVSAFDRVASFLDITAITASPTLIVDAQTQDPLTGRFATSQFDIFSGVATQSTNYALVGQLGVDRIMRLLATVGNAGGDDITFSISGLAKGGSVNGVGSTLFLGDRDVNTTMGIRLLPAQERKFYLLPNVEFWAITALDSLNIMVWELQ